MTYLSNWLVGIFVLFVSSSGSVCGLKSFYDVLEVPKEASIDVIKKKYRELSKKYHPDRNKDPNATAKFTEFSNAYEVLSDSTKREQYDRLGHEGFLEQQRHGAPDHGDFMWDFPFGAFFGGHQRSRGKEKAPTIHHRLYVSLEQLYFGDLLHVSFLRPVICLRVDDCLTQRNDCQSEGVRVITQQVGPGFIVQNQIQDDTCVGRKKGWKKNCSACPNGPTDLERTFLAVYLEAGMHTGSQVSFEGVGWQMMGHENGDLIFSVVEQPHASFVRDGNDLRYEVVITLTDALVGFERTFTHLNGDPCTLQRQEVTADGEVVQLKGKGMPLQNKEGEFGDLYVTLRVQFPVELSTEQRSKIKETLSSVQQWKYTIKLAV